MSVYGSAVDAYRDTTKWLTAFLPITALVSAGVLIGPRLARSAQSATSVWAWMADHGSIVLCLLAVLGSIAVILVAGTRVLSCAPSDLAGTTDTQEGSQALTEAIGAGAAAPAFFTREDYNTAMSELAHAWDTQSVVADDPRLVRLGAAVESLREWSLFHNMQRPFKQFQVAFVGATLVILLATAYVPFALGPSTSIEEPTTVTVQVSADGASDLERRTGCSSPTDTAYLAVGGTWEQPVLAVDGPGCDFGATWRPGNQHASLRLP